MLDVCSQGNGTKTCDPWAAKEFEAKMTEAQSKVSNLCSHCLPDCNQVVYSSTASSAKFRFENGFLLTRMVPPMILNNLKKSLTFGFISHRS